MLDAIPTPSQNNTSEALSALAILAKTREVEIELPILRTKAVVRPITGSEELRLHTMKSSGSTFIKSFNKIIFEHTTFEGLEFKDLNDFQTHLTPPDKALLVYALLDSTFSTLPEKIITCPGCGKVDTHTPEPANILHSDSIPKVWNEKLDFDKFEITTELIEGFKIIYAMPTEQDRMDILDEKENSSMRDDITEHGDILSPLEMFCVYIKRIEIKSGDKVIILEDKRKDIIPTIKNMALDLQSRLLDDESVQPLIEYTPKFYLNIHCANISCELKDFKWDNINPEQDFFRKALSVYY